MLSLSMHAKYMRLVQFWPGNGNSLEIEFQHSFPREGKQTLDIFLEDAAQAWETYDALKDENTCLYKCDDEQAARKAALEQRQRRLEAEAKRAANAGARELDDDEVPF
ncbi:MAG: hypothetical protein ABJL57_11945 [Hyphomonas sp.]|jgi:hypothetical protein|uniref:hypothetical protein n=1 Tax=Hyphomonas sp. TaxID=87 RepID=UPI003264BA73